MENEFLWDRDKYRDESIPYPGDEAFYSSEAGSKFILDKSKELLGEQISDPRFEHLLQEMNGKFVSGELWELQKRFYTRNATGTNRNHIIEKWLERLVGIVDNPLGKRYRKDYKV